MTNVIERVPHRYIEMIEAYHIAVSRRDWQTCDQIGDTLLADLGPNWLHRSFADEAVFSTAAKDGPR